MSKIEAPFTNEQVTNLNFFQGCGQFHPFTCGGTKDGKDCRADLVATKDGWICPEKCGYTQKWAHAFMGSGEIQEHLKATEEMLKKLRGGNSEEESSE